MADLFPTKRPGWQRPLNAMMRGALRNRFLAKGPGRIVLLLHLVGRKSGRRLEIPVAYARDGGDLLIGTPFGWGANLVDGGRVDLHLVGVPITATVRRFEDAERAVPVLAEMCPAVADLPHVHARDARGERRARSRGGRGRAGGGRRRIPAHAARLSASTRSARSATGATQDPFERAATLGERAAFIRIVEPRAATRQPPPRIRRHDAVDEDEPQEVTARGGPPARDARSLRRGTLGIQESRGI